MMAWPPSEVARCGAFCLKRSLATVALLLFAASAIGAPSMCRCLPTDADTAMAADHSCCLGGHKGAGADTSEDRAEDSQRAQRPASGCHCEAEISAFSQARAIDADVSRWSPVAAALAACPSRALSAVPAFTVASIRGSPPTGPPRLLDRLATVQVWRC